MSIISHIRPLLHSQLTSLVDQHGARAVCEELVEVFHAKSGDSAIRARSNAQLIWLTLACKVGNVVHWQDINWPPLPVKKGGEV